MKKFTVDHFENFGAIHRARVITAIDYDGDYSTVIFYARNPYGGHNLIAATGHRRCLRAYAHGNAQVLCVSFRDLPIKQYRRVRKFLALRGLFTDSHVSWES